MVPWELIERVRMPGGRGELCLYRRGEELSIRIDGKELMNSRAHASEEALAERICAHLEPQAKPCILIGGLGMGFSLAAALRVLGPGATLEVAEVVPEVIAWNRGPLARLSADALADPRVVVHACDVRELVMRARNRYDAIALDVDNGPAALTLASNAWLYSAPGLRAARGALRTRGVLGVWSARPDPRFAARLRDAGFTVEEERPRARTPRKGSRHTLWLATRGAD